MMKTLKLRDKMTALRRTFPKIDPNTRYLYSGALNRRERGDRVAIHILAWSADGRVTLHRTEFHKADMRVSDWGQWLRSHASGIVNNQVRAYMNRTFGSTWYIESIFGWHLVHESETARSQED
jgi:hypothetical protein